MTERGWTSLARTCQSMALAGLVLVPIAALTAHATPAPASAQIERGITKAVTAHVHVIPSNGRAGVANIGIVVGTRAVLIIESGLGRASGEAILEETRRIAGDRRIYAIATHRHLEHIGGEQAFPPSAIILRPTAQQSEIDMTGAGMIRMFQSSSAEASSLLKNFAFRTPDLLIDGSATLDLGGVTVEIVPASPAHTDGDIALLIKEDGVLFTGDVVQQDYAPILAGGRSSVPSWLAQISKLERLPVRIIVPSHTEITDRGAFADERKMLVFINDDWTAIKARGLSGVAAADALVAEFKIAFPACRNAVLLRVSIPRL